MHVACCVSFCDVGYSIMLSCVVGCAVVLWYQLVVLSCWFGTFLCVVGPALLILIRCVIFCRFVV